MKGQDVVFSSNTDEWGTPEWFFEKLDNEYHFTLDVCATAENHKCDRYFTKEDNGLAQSWKGECVFCNPPYSQIVKWVEKAYYEAQQEDTTVVMLIHARTDTRWFHEYVYHIADIWFVKGRLKFVGPRSKVNAPFPSMVCIYKDVPKDARQISLFD